MAAPVERTEKINRRERRNARRSVWILSEDGTGSFQLHPGGTIQLGVDETAEFGTTVSGTVTWYVRVTVADDDGGGTSVIVSQLAETAMTTPGEGKTVSDLGECDIQPRLAGATGTINVPCVAFT